MVIITIGVAILSVIFLSSPTLQAPQDVPGDGAASVTLFGNCFVDEATRRLPEGVHASDQDKFTSSNTPEFCVNACKEKGFGFAGVEWGKQCFCGNTEPAVDKKVPASECNMACPGDSSVNCGASWRMNIYSTSV